MNERNEPDEKQLSREEMREILDRYLPPIAPPPGAVIRRHERGIPQEEWRPLCWGCEDGTAPCNCQRCHDAGFVRTGGAPGDKNFGKTRPCPQCVLPPAEINEYEKRGMRIPQRLMNERIETWVAGPDGLVLREQVLAYARDWPPKKPMLVLQGPRGNGKSHLASGVLHELFDERGVRGEFWHCVDLLDRYKATFHDGAVETIEGVEAELRRLPVMVLDDLGAEKGTEFAEERLRRLVDERYRELKPLVVTTNIGVGSLDQRIWSRLVDGASSVIVHFRGEDVRKTGRRVYEPEKGVPA